MFARIVVVICGVNRMDDLISRADAIEAAMRDVSCIRTHEFNAGATRAANRIKQLPSAEPEIIHCEDCKYGILEPSFPHQWFCKFKGDEWNNSDYFCGHARKREVTE